MSERAALIEDTILDLVFEVEGRQIPEDYRYLLWCALSATAPWLGAESATSIVGISIVRTNTETALLSHRSRMTLRLPQSRLDDARHLEGVRVRIGGDEIRIGPSRKRPIHASPTIYSPLVVLDREEELGFSELLKAELQARAPGCHAILGRRRSVRLENGSVNAFPVALHGCKPALSLQIQAVGIGRRREVGCGVFVPHKKIENFE